MFTFLASTYKSTNGGNFSGAIWRCERDDGFSAVMKRIYLPPATCPIERYPSGDNYGNRQYLVGGHTANLLIDQQYRCVKQSMRAPNTLPAASVGAGAVDQLLYTRFYDEVTDERSPLSDPLPLTGNVTRAWTTLPTEVPSEAIDVPGTVTFAAGAVTGVLTNFGEMRPGDRIALASDLTRWATILTIDYTTSMTIDDTGMAGAGVAIVCRPVSRASHVELWVAVSGDLPRFTNVRLRIGTTAYTESTATLALGEAEVVSFDAMPLGEINLFYNDRQLIAGVEGHRDTVYLSAIGFPERYEGLAFVTAYNEPIVGMFRFRDYVVLLCPDSSYRLQGYTEDDYARTVLEPHIGGLGHHGNRVGEGAAFVPSRKGVQIFNGAFHQGIPTRREEWQQLCVENARSYESGLGCINPNDETYVFMPYVSALSSTYDNIHVTTPLIFVGAYNTIGAQADGSLTTPEWSSDTYQMPASSSFPDSTTVCTYQAYLTPSGQKIGRMYRADDQGEIFRDVLTEDETAAGFEGNSVITSAHFLLGDPGGNRDEGKRLIRMWSYYVAEDSVSQFTIWPGDEFAYPPDIYSLWRHIIYDGGDQTQSFDLLVPGFRDSEIASIKQDTATIGNAIVGTNSYFARWGKKTVHPHQVEGQPVVGRGFTFEWVFAAPNSVTWIGFGGVYEAGTTSRPVWIVESGGG